MLQYIARRFLVLPLILFLVTLILFGLMLQLPVEMRAEVYMPSVGSNATAEQMAQITETIIRRYGLDEPLPVQYAAWVKSLLVGEWGYSPVWKESVLEGLLRRVPASAELALAAMVPAIVLAVVLGSVSSRCDGRFVGQFVRGTAFVGWAFPSFILGLMMLNVLYAWLRWFPPGRLSTWASVIVNGGGFRTYTGMYTVDALLNGNVAILLDALRHLILPASSLGLAQWALLTRIMRSSLLEALRQDYITTARAKGVDERKVVNVHARRNAILPVVSASSVAVSMLISGLVVIETVFDMNGVGGAATKAILAGDVSVVIGFTVFTCLVTMLSSLAADITYAFIDRRVTLG
ncbi:MAG: ABC transporter permease [Chloroflexi bacterium]|nr:ABC transporter permease [Chloroflexota bacterium]